MKATIKYQGAFLAIVISTFGILSLCANIFVGSGGDFSLSSLSLAVALLLVVVIILTRMTMQYNIFGVATYLPAMLILLFAAAMTDASNYLQSVVSALLTLLAIRNLNEAFSSVSATSKIFSAAIWIGTLPLIFPPAIIMIFALAVGLLLYERDARDYVVMLVGVAIPALLVTYYLWLFNDVALSDSVGIYVERLLTSSNWKANYIFDARSFSFSLALLLTLISFLKISNLAVTSAARSRIFLAAIWCAIAVFMLFIPSFEIAHFAVVAPAVAIAAASALITTRWWISIILFAVATLTAPLQIFW